MSNITNSNIENYNQFLNIKEIGEVIEGYLLGQDTITKEYYLIESRGKPGDELFKFSEDILIFDPFRGMKDKDIDALPKTDPKNIQFNKYMNNMDAFQSLFIMDIFKSINLYDNAKKSGYNKDKHGSLPMWILDKIEDTIKKDGQ